MRKLSCLALVLLFSTVSFAGDFYSVNVKRVSQDLYEVIGENIRIVTRYCYEYTYGDEAIVRIDSTAGFTVGEIIFDSGTKCDIAKLI
tara:strand:- start:110 stop:373 length:264 start_codon:yes stop_codon:yes gene_type:complete